MPRFFISLSYGKNGMVIEVFFKTIQTIKTTHRRQVKCQ